MGDLPLRTPIHHRLGGPLPRLLPNGTHPHPLPINLWCAKNAYRTLHPGLLSVSRGYTEVRERLDTRYSPVRRSPSEFASKLHDAPRLACVKPVASVHPEPGSNSSLYKYLRYFYESSSSLGNRKQAFIPLAPRSLVNLIII